MVHATLGGENIKKPYSIASTNKQLQEQKLLSIVVKKASQTGMSDRMTQHMRVGDIVDIQGPVGHYTDNKTHPHYLFVSIGSGLSPNVGLFQHLIYEQQFQGKCILLHGVRYANDVVSAIHTLLLAEDIPHTQYRPYLSQQEHLPNGYHAGYVQDGLAAAIEHLGTATNCFICGKPEMVTDVAERLEKLGIAKQDITFEKY